MAVTADILVVGLGAVGSAALHQAAKLGVKVIGIDRFTPPHELGSSHGETRITRQAIGEGREFVPLVLRSNEIWEELEAATGRRLMTRNGGLVLAAPSVGGNHHGSRSFLQDTVDAAKAYGIAHEVLLAEEIRRRFPQFRLTDDEQGYFESGAGFLRPELCIETQLQEARRLGAEVRCQEAVLAVQTDGNAVEVTTDKARYSVAKVIAAAGPWITLFLGEELRPHFRIYRQTLCWFEVKHDSQQFMPEHFPVFIWITGRRVQDMLYGFPAIDGPGSGVKVATESYDETVDPDRVNHEVSDESVNAMYRSYVAPRFPDVGERCLRTATCLYTVTPDAKFVVDYADEQRNVLFASACSGHGFKHSPAVGEALVRRALGLVVAVDLSAFGAKRLTAQR